MKPPSPQAPGAAQGGFTLLSVLIAVVILSFGLLVVGKTYLSVLNGSTQNQDISSLAELSNEFWGAAQGTPSVLDTLASGTKTYSAANMATAPVALQSWLAHLVYVIPDAQATITTAAGCSSVGGCGVTVVVQWTQYLSEGGGPVARQQRFDYQFG